MVGSNLSVVLGYASYGVGISVFLIALAYMMGRALENEKYIAFSKNQLAETLLVFIIIFSYALFDPIMENLVMSLNPIGYSACGAYKAKPISDLEIYQDPIPPTMNCYVGSSILFMDSLFYEIKYMFLQITILQTTNGFIETTHLETPKVEKKAGFSYNGVPLFTGLARITTINLKNMATFLINASMFVFFQKYFLLFFYYAGPTIFGVGLFLRFFPISRRIGGLLMAIYLAVMFVFPLTYNLFYALYLNNDISKATQNYGTRLVRVAFAVLDDKKVFGRIGKTPLEINKEVEDSIKGTGTTKFGERIDENLEKIYREAKSYESKKINDATTNFSNLNEGDVKNATNLFKDFLKFLWDSTIGGEGLKQVFDFIRDMLLVVSRLNLVMYFQTDIIYGGILGIRGGNAGVTILDVMIEDVSHIVLYTYLTSVIAAITTIAAIKDLSPLLGGDIEIAGITHFI